MRLDLLPFGRSWGSLFVSDVIIVGTVVILDVVVIVGGGIARVIPAFSALCWRATASRSYMGSF
jgi:hypothetical protein